MISEPTRQGGHAYAGKFLFKFKKSFSSRSSILQSFKTLADKVLSKYSLC